MTVEDICRSLNTPQFRVAMGFVDFEQKPNEETLRRFSERLTDVGFEPIESESLVALEKIKAHIRHYARNAASQSLKLSSFMEAALGTDFRSVSRLFSAMEGRTVQKYLMLQRIEFVKELLLDDDMTITEIADVAGFSSVAHLSTAFKKVTGLTLSDFKASGHRLGLDEV